MTASVGREALVRRALGSRALVADAKKAFACGWLSAAVVIGAGRMPASAPVGG